MAHTTIDQDKTRQIPEEMSEEWLREYFHHCRELGQNGNPGGYIMTINLFPFMGFEGVWEGETYRGMKPYSEWDYEGMRQWIREHHEEALLSWQRYVRSVW